MQRFLENHTATFREVFGERVFECEVLTAVGAGVGPGQRVLPHVDIQLGLRLQFDRAGWTAEAAPTHVPVQQMLFDLLFILKCLTTQLTLE